MPVDATQSAPPLAAAAIDALARRMDRPLVLVGLMGAGKSTVGRKLAATLALPFTDADDAIEEAARMPVADIFDRFGEAHFRDGERRVIARLMEADRGVIATGGGAFCEAETRALILARGVAIWLDGDVGVLAERVARRDTRPLLRDGDPQAVLARLDAQRRPFYAQAPIRVASSEGPHSQTLARILEALDRWL